MNDPQNPKDEAKIAKTKQTPKTETNISTTSTKRLIPREEAPFNAEPFFLGDLLVAAGLFYVGYELGQVGQDLNARLRDLNNTIKGIAADINQITQDIHAIVELLKQL